MLINTQLEFKTQADTLDLECAIKETNIMTEDVQPVLVSLAENVNDVISSEDIWPPETGQYIYTLFDDGVFPGEVKSWLMVMRYRSRF